MSEDESTDIDGQLKTLRASLAWLQKHHTSLPPNVRRQLHFYLKGIHSQFLEHCVKDLKQLHARIEERRQCLVDEFKTKNPGQPVPKFTLCDSVPGPGLETPNTAVVADAAPL